MDRATLTAVTSPEPMRALITGATGFVGPHLTSHLMGHGDDVTGIGHGDGPDLLDAEGWTQLVARAKPDVIYHLAGFSDVGRSWKAPREAFRLNAEGTMSVLEAARLNKVKRVVVVSSADVYGIASPASLPLAESAPIQPRSPYGASKQAAEALAHQYSRGWGLDVIVVRPFNHIGPGQSTNFFAPAIATKIARAELAGGGKVTHGDLSPERDFTDVRDVVRAYRLIATAGRNGCTYNVCTGKAVAMSSILDHLIGAAMVPISTEPDPELVRPVDLPVLRGSFDALQKDTGWEPSIELNETLADVLSDARQRITDPEDSADPGTSTDPANRNATDSDKRHHAAAKDLPS